MGNMRDQLDDIEKYLMDEMTNSEREAFEKKIKEDRMLKEKVDHFRSLLKGIESGFNRELKSLLQEEEMRLRNSNNREKNKTRTLYYAVGLAASIALIIVMVFITKNQPPDNEALFLSYYQPYPNVESPVARSDSKKGDAYALYENGNYPEALELFDKLVAENPSDPAPVFYLGICNLELNNTEMAIAFFKSIQTFDLNKYTRPASWYLALSYFKTDDIQNAVTILENLADGDDTYAKKSQELLKRSYN
jgi:tetratricopeptide (TPR) repeat protein